MRVSNFQVDELLPLVFWLHGGCDVFYCGSVSDTDETENGIVTFGDTGDVVLEVGPDGACICSQLPALRGF